MPDESKFGEPWITSWGIHGGRFGIISLNQLNGLDQQMPKCVCASMQGDFKVEKATAERIVACVNFCRGIPTKQMEGKILDFGEFTEIRDA